MTRAESSVAADAAGREHHRQRERQVVDASAPRDHRRSRPTARRPARRRRQVTTVRAGTTRSARTRPSSPAISTMHAPTVSATSGRWPPSRCAGPSVRPTSCTVAALTAGSDAVERRLRIQPEREIASTSGRARRVGHRDLTRLDALTAAGCAWSGCTSAACRPTPSPRP